MNNSIFVLLIKNNPLKILVDGNADKFKHLKKKFVDLEDHKKYFIDLNGHKYDSDLCDSIEQVIDQWYNQAMRIWLDKKENAKFQNVKDYFEDLFKEFIKNDADELRQLKTAIFKSYQNYLCVYISCNNISDCSLKELGSFIVFPGNDEEFPGGYSTLINHMASKLPKDSIKYNHPVEKVSIENDNLKIECKNSSIFYAKYLIVTCSLNYLKENYMTLFNTEVVLFSEKKVEAMNKLCMGVVDNFLLIYENDIQFIPKDVDSLTPLCINNDENNNDFTRKWYHSIYRIIKFYDNVLRFFLYGDEAIYLESVSDEEIIRTITYVLKKLIPDKAIPEPKKLIR